jgi:arginine decarboxylase-like protein
MNEKDIKKELNKVDAYWKSERKYRDKFGLKIKELLEEHGEVKFDWEEGNAPSVVSAHFGDDVADCYVTRVGFNENGSIVCDLHAYYIGEDCCNVSIDDVCCTAADYADMLSEMLQTMLYENEE